MSRTEIHFGRLVKVCEGKEECEKHAINILNAKIKLGHVKIPESVDFTEPLDELFSWFSEEYFIDFKRHRIYYIADHKEIGDDGDYNTMLIPQTDGSITFVSQFYNGACGLNECLEEEFDKIEEKKIL